LFFDYIYSLLHKNTFVKRFFVYFFIFIDNNLKSPQLSDFYCSSIRKLSYSTNSILSFFNFKL
jgi:hypothetical protein